MEGRFNEGLFALPVGGGGLYLEGAYAWRGLFSEFYGISSRFFENQPNDICSRFSIKASKGRRSKVTVTKEKERRKRKSKEKEKRRRKKKQ